MIARNWAIALFVPACDRFALEIDNRSVSSGTQWRFLKLEGNTVTIDLTDYPLPPVEQILGMLVWMIQNG